MEACQVDSLTRVAFLVGKTVAFRNLFPPKNPSFYPVRGGENGGFPGGFPGMNNGGENQGGFPDQGGFPGGNNFGGFGGAEAEQEPLRTART